MATTSLQSQTQSSQSTNGAAEAEKAPARSSVNRLTIEVTGGDENKPIENASVYLKTLQQGKLKDKKFEVNVKTNMEGKAHVPDAPTGRVLIQIVVTGWKTYGHWYDVTDPTETIKIHLERPPKWY
jgi:hypothetical protein